jgi:hypothetical protein
MLRVARYLPWLTHWWMTQKWFPGSNIEAVDPKLMIYHLRPGSKNLPHEKEVRQQDEFECPHRDIMIRFGRWEFDPMDLDNLYPNNEGCVHLCAYTLTFLITFTPLLHLHSTLAVIFLSFINIPFHHHLYTHCIQCHLPIAFSCLAITHHHLHPTSH